MSPQHEVHAPCKHGISVYDVCLRCAKESPPSNPVPPSERPGVLQSESANVGETVQICNLHTGSHTWDVTECRICQLRGKLAAVFLVAVRVCEKCAADSDDAVGPMSAKCYSCPLLDVRQLTKEG